MVQTYGFSSIQLHMIKLRLVMKKVWYFLCIEKMHYNRACIKGIRQRWIHCDKCAAMDALI